MSCAGREFAAQRSNASRQSDDVRAHGEDERVGVKAFFQGGKYLYRLVRWRGRVRRCALTNFCPPPCTLTGMGNRT